MSAINELKEGLEQTQTAEFVTTMLRDISATKLQAIRGEFEANREYFAELHELMALVQSYAIETNVNYEHPKAGSRIYVAITSNKRFYGNLNREIMQEHHAALLANRLAASMVVGVTGHQFVENHPLPSPTDFFAFTKDEPTDEELYGLIAKLAPYEEVFIIHPTFINSFQQHPRTTDITHRVKPRSKKTKHSIDYLFEPDIPKILEFFRTQIRLTLFVRVLLETEVAFTGARLMKMQRAREKAHEMVTQQERVIHKQVSTVKNMRLLETFTGFNKKML